MAMIIPQFTILGTTLVWVSTFIFACTSAVYFHKEDNVYLADRLIGVRTVRSLFECGVLCTTTVRCKSANYKKSGKNKGRCELNDGSMNEYPDSVESNNDNVYLENIDKIFCQGADNKCKLESADICQCLLKKCSTTDTGVYDVTTPDSSVIPVFCDQTTDNGGWLVIQRNNASGVWFDKTWQEFKHGFGNMKHSFWWGNEKMHRFTSSGQYELRVDLKLNDGSDGFAKYNGFKITSELDKYRLLLSNVGFSGNIADSMFYPHFEKHQSVGKPFTTKDRDNDVCPTNCAVEMTAGGWYGWCSVTVLNRANPNWVTLNGRIINAEMKIRRRNFCG